MSHLLSALLTRFVPPDIASGDPDVARQGRLVIYFMVVIEVAAATYATVYLLLGMPVASAGALAAVVMAPLVAEDFRRRGDIARSGHLLGLTAVVALVGVTLGTGALGSPATSWFILSPFIPAMIAGRRAGVPWVLASVGYFGLLYALHLLGLSPANELPSSFFVDLYDMIVPTGLILAVFAIAWSYEVAREDSLGRIREAGRALEAASARIQQAHSEARMILDSVSDALLLVRTDGVLEGGRSARVDEWLGTPGPNATLWSLFASADPGFAEWLALCWEDLADPERFMPAELILSQLPAQLCLQGRHLALHYHPQDDGQGDISHVLVVISDVTAQVEAAAAERAQQELMAIFTRLLQDQSAVEEFLAETSRLITQLAEGTGTHAEDLRWLHTLKGNCGIFGLHSFATWVHGLESILAEQDERMTVAQRQALHEQWTALETRLAPVLSCASDELLTVERATYEATIALAEMGAAPDSIAAELRRWEWDRVRLRLERLAERTRTLAQRMSKEHVQVIVEAEDLRQPPGAAWTTFWSAMIHMVRNAVDHGIEDHSTRQEQHKDEPAAVILRARSSAGQLILEIADNGRGIAWERIQQRAATMGLPFTTPEQRIRALFADGLSTCEEVTELSGRGVGTSAVWAACEDLGGQIEVDSTPGLGTCFRFRFSEALLLQRAA